ncbi:MAG: hypothetical protein WC828_06170 [Thermoleophilia bacterium]|jgi:hypothetical protein
MKIRTIRRSIIGSLMTLLLLGTGLTFYYSSALGASGPPISGLWSPSHPDQNAWYSNSAPDFTWAPSGSSYSYEFDQNPATVPDDTPDTASAYAPFAGVADGTWYFHVKANMLLLGWGDPSTVRVQIDTTGPTVTDLASPTHPDENTAYADHNPSFSWNSSTVELLGTCCGISGGGLGVAVSGNYAYIVDGTSGLKIIDISNPANPQSAGSFNTPGSGEGVAVSGNYAYVADGSNGLRIINISSPSSPQEVGSWATGSSSSKNVAILGRYAYVADRSNGLQILDVNDPANPQPYGSINPGIVAGVAVSGNYAYLASWYSGFQIVDVTNPANPQLKGTVTASSIGSAAVAVAGNYAYVADTSNGLMVMDVTSKTSPQLVGSIKPPGTASSVALSGNYAYLADGTGGLHVIDIANPASPVLKGTYDTAHTASGVAVVGNYAYVADGSLGGLQVLRFTPSSFSYVLDQNPGTDPDTTIDGTAVTASYTGIGDGTWYFHVKAVDDLGNWGAPVHRQIKTFSDSIAPTTNATGPSGWQTAAFNINLSCSDNAGGSGCYRSFYNMYGSWYIGTTVPIVQEDEITIEFYSTDIAGNEETPHKFTTAKLDTIAPAITNIVPTGSMRGSQQTIEADLVPEWSSGSGVDAASSSILLDGAALTACTKSVTHISCSANILSGGSHGISVSVKDVAGNTGTGSGTFNIASRNYYWTWYDNLSSMNWVLMANPAGATPITYDYHVAANVMSNSLDSPPFGSIAGGASAPARFYNASGPNAGKGMIGGSVMASSVTGEKAIASQRSLWKGGNSLEEVLGTDAERLSDHYYWTWYDNKSPGMFDWVMVSNPSGAPIYYRIKIAGSVPGAGDTLEGTAEGTIIPEGSANARFNLKNGPVEVETWSDSVGGSTPVPAIASQRVLTNMGTPSEAFNEVPGIPFGELSSDYLWTWYDNVSPGAYDWVLVANPHLYDIYYRITVKGALASPIIEGAATGTIAAGKNVTPRFSTINGPLEVKTCQAAFVGDTCPDADPALGQSIASQRTIWGPSFEEVPGYPKTALTNDYHWTWYDQLDGGTYDWVHIINTDSAPVNYRLTVGGVLPTPVVEGAATGTIAPGELVHPRFLLRSGPVEVKACKLSFNPDGSCSDVTPATVMTSQRVLWHGYFNEVLGTVLN